MLDVQHLHAPNFQDTCLVLNNIDRTKWIPNVWYSNLLRKFAKTGYAMNSSSTIRRHQSHHPHHNSSILTTPVFRHVRSNGHHNEHNNGCSPGICTERICCMSCLVPGPASPLHLVRRLSSDTPILPMYQSAYTCGSGERSKRL